MFYWILFLWKNIPIIKNRSNSFCMSIWLLNIRKIIRLIRFWYFTYGAHTCQVYSLKQNSIAEFWARQMNAHKVFQIKISRSIQSNLKVFLIPLWMFCKLNENHKVLDEHGGRYNRLDLTSFLQIRTFVILFGTTASLRTW